MTEGDDVPEETGQRGVCDCCGYPNLPTEMFGHSDQEQHELCRLCAGTFAGNTLRHPGRYTDEASVRTICFVGNAILDQLGTFREWQQDHQHIRDEDL